MNPVVGWGLAVLAVAAGWLGWGWRGVVLAVTVVVFWLLLQFSRTLRVLRAAGQRPVGTIDNAVMVAARLRPGLPLLEVIRQTHSLGQRLRQEPETWAWVDGGGDRVEVQLASGRVEQVRLLRAGPSAPDPSA
jgi:hypothetical protein